MAAINHQGRFADGGFVPPVGASTSHVTDDESVYTSFGCPFSATTSLMLCSPRGVVDVGLALMVTVSVLPPDMLRVCCGRTTSQSTSLPLPLPSSPIRNAWRITSWTLSGAARLSMVNENFSS
jgi:hypothetical protein